jgi:CheY-like chemotaxis protein
MMRLLIVENNASFEADLRGGIAGIANVVIEVARSREEAVRAINDGEYDLILCDLRIPSAVGRVDAAVEHGLAVHSHARLETPGTPVVVMSAYGTLDIVKGLYEAAPREDPFGLRRDEPMSTFFQKSDLPELVEHVKTTATHRAALENIAIHSGGVDFGLSVADRTVIRLFCRRHDGVVARLRPLRPGLSSARVIRIEVVDEHGARRSQALAKLSSYLEAVDEAARFRRLVAPQLASGAFAHLIDEVKAGACRTAGLFYWFAGGNGDPDAYSSSLFDLLPDNEDVAVRAVEGLKERLRPWVAAAHQEELTVRDVRRLLVDDQEFADIAPGLVPESASRVEDMQVYVNRGPEHGDLHGFNVLVRADAAAVIIDFGSLMSAPITVDPVTLELSTLFHPDSPMRDLEWPSLEQAREWTSMDNFAAGSPITRFLGGCREWAHERSASDGEVFAVAYAYAVRQLKYPRTNHERANAIAEAALEALENS